MQGWPQLQESQNCQLKRNPREIYYVHPIHHTSKEKSTIGNDDCRLLNPQQDKLHDTNTSTQAKARILSAHTHINFVLQISTSSYWVETEKLKRNSCVLLKQSCTDIK